jgi:hypothetical protein
MKKDWQNSTYPYARVKDDPRFIEHAKNNQWADRRDNGYPWKADIFEFLANTYGEFLDKGKMTQACLKSVDEKGWWALQNALRKHDLPENLHLPKDSDLKLMELPEDDEVVQKQKRAIWREANNISRKIKSISSKETIKPEWDKSAYPYARVKDDPRFIEHAKNNQWADRRDNGYPWKMDVFQFIANEYGEWLDTGKMVQADLRSVDTKLYQEFHKRLANGVSMPTWLKLPTKADKVMADAKTPEEKRTIEVLRVYFRQQKKQQLALNN